MRDERKADEYKRKWINSRFQLLGKDETALPAVFIPLKNVTIPVSQSILDDTGIECAQVRGMTSTADYEAAFLESKEWDTQFPGVVTIIVTPHVLEVYKRFFTGKKRDDPKASIRFRQALGAMVLEDPTQFMYAVTDGAHRTKLGKVHFLPEVSRRVRSRLTPHRVGTRLLQHPLSRAADGIAQQHGPCIQQARTVHTQHNVLAVVFVLLRTCRLNNETTHLDKMVPHLLACSDCILSYSSPSQSTSRRATLPPQW